MCGGMMKGLMGGSGKSDPAAIIPVNTRPLPEAVVKVEDPDKKKARFQPGNQTKTIAPAVPGLAL